MFRITLVFIALCLFGCENFQNNISSPMSSAKACTESNGVWTPINTLLPEQELGAEEENRSICNIQTHDKGQSCYISRACEGSCLAPAGAKPGDRVEGSCSGHILVSKGTLTIDLYRVSQTGKSTASYPAKINRLKRLYSKKTKWLKSNISDYELMIRQDCFCSHAPAFGPNKVIVKNSTVSSVHYFGETWDGFSTGDDLEMDDGISLSVDELFDRAEQLIINAPQNADLQVAYDSTYGFPTLLTYDHPDLADEESRVEVFNFKTR